MSQVTNKPWKHPNLPPRPFTFSPNKLSLLDQISQNSQLNQSQLRGLFNLAFIFTIIFLFTQPVVNFIDQGYFLDPTLYNTFQNDFIFCLSTWPLFFAWSFTSFFLQKLITMGLNKTFALFLQHLTQSGLFAYSTYIILANDWCSTHAAFVIMQACVHFMKMHSYITVNRDYRQDYQESMKQNRQPQSNYPKNITLSDFLTFMLTPWLVYAEYPRRSHIDWIYVFRKTIMVLILLLTMYLVHSSFIQPWIEKGNEIGLIELMFRFMVPGIVFQILGFYLVFENLCNLFAELSKLDYRQFYEDWWNSTTYQQFNRKWNKPVHIFLYRHVYLQAIVKWKTSKSTAQILTFSFSALLHEFLFMILFRIIRPIFLGFIVAQVPMIKFTKWMASKRIGLYYFWLGLTIGPTIIVCFYLRIDSAVTLMFTKQTE